MALKALLWVAALTLSALTAASAAGSAPDGCNGTAAAEIGAWRVQAWNTRTQAFAGCTAYRVDDRVIASVARSTSSFNLVRSSSRWHLEAVQTAAASADLDRCWREQGSGGATSSIGKARS